MVPTYLEARIVIGINESSCVLFQFILVAKLPRQISFGHRPIQHRLFDGLVAAAQKTLSGYAIFGAQTFLFSGDLVLKIINSVFALIEPVTILPAYPFDKQAIQLSPPFVSEWTSSWL